MISTSVKFALRSKESDLKPIRSRVMFRGNFKEELRKTMDAVEKAIEKNLGDRFVVDSILGGNNNLKIRIDDQEDGTERIVNCIFRYHHDDERYGNIHIDLVVSWLGVKKVFRSVGKFHLSNREAIRKKILENMTDCLISMP